MAVSGRKVSGSAKDYDYCCEPCLAIGQYIEAHGFCVDCQEYLCKTCFACHQRTKASKHHQLLDKTSIDKQIIHSKDSTVCNEKCQIHKNEIIKFFCTNHEFLGCTDCITPSHRTCKIDYIPDKCAGIRDSGEYRETMKALEQKMKDVAVVIKKATLQDKGLDLSHDHVVKETVKFRNEINDHLDKQQKQFLTDAEKKKLKDKQTLKNVLDTCAAVSSDIMKVKSSLQDSKTSQQNGQLYIMIKQAKSNLKLDDLKNAQETLDKTSIQYTFERNKELENLLTNQYIFGKLTQSTTLVTNIGDINVQTILDNFKHWITGCVVLSSNKVMIVDGNNCSLKVVDTQSKVVIEEKTLESRPWDICILPQDHIAVTMPDQKTILVMATNGKISIIRRIPFQGKCGGVTYHQDHLYVVCLGPICVIKIDIQGNVIDMIYIENEIFASPNYILLSKDATHIYISDCKSHSVACVSLQGDILAVYKHKDLRVPMGMVMIDDGSLIVCCYNCNGTIHHISRDLKRGQTISDGLQYPQSICYNSKEQKVYIGGLCDQLKIKKFGKKK
ncbi:uncharacterized protein LOC123536695 [Mercenaria mercenaria]|uniref:uncharacterized protein LOC123536695 n=1 Tax=Mercenaria mercenaria TaxID=6596 RepID=UPI00234F569D|nr:uncharacterized protein LOC123536695 [Mercenaria mercenaria]